MLLLYKGWGMLGHNGVDFAAIDEEPVCFDCSCKGTVLSCKVDSAGGLGIEILTEEEDEIFKHRYWHLKSFSCKAGDIVESGQIIGLADNTGISTGTHLHRDMKRMARDSYGNLYKAEPNNGYLGAEDIMPYFRNIFVLDVMNNLTAQVSILGKLVNAIKEFLGLKRSLS